MAIDLSPEPELDELRAHTAEFVRATVLPAETETHRWSIGRRALRTLEGAGR